MVPVERVPGWLYASRKIEAHHEGRRFLASSQVAIAVEGPIDPEPSPLRYAMAMADTYLPAPVGRPFLRLDARIVLGDAREEPRTGLDLDDYAIPVGPLLVDMRYAAIVHFLFPGCAWFAPRLPGFAVAKIEGSIVALVAPFAPKDSREEAQIREMVVLNGA